MWPNPQETFTEEILNGKLHFFCAVLGWCHARDSSIWDVAGVLAASLELEEFMFSYTAKNSVIPPNFMESDFRKAMQKVCLSTKFPHQGISWNYDVFQKCYCSCMQECSRSKFPVVIGILWYFLFFVFINKARNCNLDLTFKRSYFKEIFRIFRHSYCLYVRRCAFNIICAI